MTVRPGDLAGCSVSHYSIVEKIGAGGMGEVYRALDLELKREVALKVLPSGVTADEERLARFRREAELLASLNHPNIAQIYGLAVSPDVRALVMELVEGGTLAERMAKGPIAVGEALGIARQIAAGLASAHDRGIVHRDLKPANIKLAPAGTVKILDFGLAKAMEAGPAAPAGSGTPTMTGPAMTYAGLILGTAAYMSPEQARGENVDRRSDIWAFGVILLEMLSGKPCFSGRTVSDYIAAVIRDEPDWSAIPPQVPAPISGLLHRCLKKDPLKRLRDIGDAVLEIDDALAEPAPPTGRPEGRSPRSWKRWAPCGITALFAIIAGIVVRSNRIRPPAPLNDVVRVTMALPAPLAAGERCALALSRDGRKFAFVGGEGVKSRIFVQDSAAFDARPLPGTEGGTGPFFSPDGEWLGFFTSSQLKKISLRGGEPIALCPNPPVSRGASWGDDNRIVFSRTMNGELVRISAAGGTPETLTKLDEKAGELAHLWPEVLPGAKTVIFTVRTGESFATASIAAQSLETGRRQTLVENGSFARTTPTGHLLYMRGDAIIAVPFDAQRLRVSSNPVPVVEGVRLDPRFGCGQFAVAASGTLIYLKGDARGIKCRLVAVDRAGREIPLLDELGAFSDPYLSPDGRQLVVSIQGTNQDLWLVDLPRRTLSRLTFDLTEEFSPRWSPDGRRLFFGFSEPGGDPQMYVMDSDGSGGREPVLGRAEFARFPGSVAPDGRSLAYIEAVADENADVWVLPLAGHRQPLPFVKTPFNEFAPEFSPDGRSLAYVSNESGRLEVYVRPFPGPGPRRQVSIGGGTSPAWSKRGGELFYRNGDAVMAAAVTAGPPFSSAVPKAMFRGEYEEPARPDWPRNYDVMPDGRRFVMIKPDPDGRPAQAQIVFHWFGELQRQTNSGR